MREALLADDWDEWPTMMKQAYPDRKASRADDHHATDGHAGRKGARERRRGRESLRRRRRRMYRVSLCRRAVALMSKLRLPRKRAWKCSTGNSPARA